MTIASTGNASDFDDLGNTHNSASIYLSSETRGGFAGSSEISPGKYSNKIYNYSSTGNAVDFGDLNSRHVLDWDLLHHLKRIICWWNQIQVTLNITPLNLLRFHTTGNATDFGDLVDHSKSSLA